MAVLNNIEIFTLYVIYVCKSSILPFRSFPHVNLWSGKFAAFGRVIAD